MLGLLSTRPRGGRSIRALKGAVILAGALGLAVLAGQVGPSSTAEASSGLRYQRGYYLTNGWYCYGWANGAYRCTQHWHRAGNRIVSDNPSWVPNNASVGNAWRASAASGPRLNTRLSQPAPRTYSSGPNTYPWGQCTWYARARGGAKVNGLGNAIQWLGRARARGLATGSTPRVGAIAVFAPGVQGASSLGHLGYVEKVYSNGRFLVSEMNYYGYGGGFGRVSYRTASTGGGVSFIY